MKKMLMVLLAVCLMLCAGSAMADEVTFIERRWDHEKLVVTESPDTKTIDIEVTDDLSEYAWGDGLWYAVRGDVTITQEIRVKLHQTANLVLCNGANLTVRDGIVLENGATLNIYGQEGDSGRLNAVIKGYSDGFNSSYVTIHGGTVNATNNDSDAAINGVVAICGGTVNATNNGSGAAIGGDVYIYGGTVNATNNGKGAAIHGDNVVALYGGDITAKGGNGMPCIDGGSGKVIIFGSEKNVLTAQYGVQDASDSSWKDTIDWGDPVEYDKETNVTTKISGNVENDQHGCFHLREGRIPDENPPENPPENPAKIPAADLPQTGDPSSLLCWACLLAASGAGLKIRRKK